MNGKLFAFGWTIEFAATFTPIPALTPLAERVFLTPMTHEYQKLNHCGPVALAIALSYYGVEPTQFDIAPLVKGYDKDKNASPEEMLAGLAALGDNGGCGRNPRPALARCIIVGVKVCFSLLRF